MFLLFRYLYCHVINARLAKFRINMLWFSMRRSTICFEVCFLHSRPAEPIALCPPPPCVQMDFTGTFQIATKCNNINNVLSQFYKILVVLGNIFDTYNCRSINITKKAKYTTLLQIFMHLEMSASKILTQGRLWHFKTTKNLKY